MPKKINYQLNKDDLAAIEEAMKKGETSRIRERATGIRLLHLGHKPKEVARMLNVTNGTISNWHKRWREKGIEGLADAQKKGRPSVATPEYCEQLEKLIEQDPQELGYGFTIWTVPRIGAHLAKETGISMCDESLRRLLDQNGYVHRRPKHTLKDLQEPEGKEQAEETIEMLKKKPKTEKSSYFLRTKQPSPSTPSCENVG